jgi:hypothetical protein
MQNLKPETGQAARRGGVGTPPLLAPAAGFKNNVRRFTPRERPDFLLPQFLRVRLTVNKQKHKMFNV